MSEKEAVKKLNEKPFPREVEMCWRDETIPERVIILHSFDDDFDGTLIYQPSRRYIRHVDPTLIRELEE